MQPMKRIICMIMTFLYIAASYAQTEGKRLRGTVIGTEYSVNYATNTKSTTVNTCQNAFDGKLDTYFASYERSHTWCGLDLGTQHVITRVGWSPRNDSNGPKRVVLAVIEGANEPDFSDGMPIYLVQEAGRIGEITYADVNVTRGFRYVRYIGPNDARCNIAEVEFYGYEGEGTDSCFYQATRLPLVSIHVEKDKDPIDKVNDLTSIISIVSEEGTQLLQEPGSIRLRGNASMNFPKKPYRIKFEKKQRVLDAPAKAKKWTLINNYGDKTLMRNMLAFEISRRMGMEYTPFCHPVDVIVNGEYKGCYQLCDQIEVNKNRVNIEEMDSSCVAGSELSGGYMIEVDAYATDEPLYFYSSRNCPVTIKYPDDEDIVQKQVDYIRSRYNAMENRIFATNYTSEKGGYRDYLDLESFLKHFLVGELSGNTDTYWSVYMYKHRDDPLFYTGPVWDFDLAFENDNRTYPIVNKSDYIYRSGGSYAGNMKSFVDRIVISDAKAKKTLSELWSYARNDNELTAEAMEELIHEWAEDMDQSQKLNFTRWPIMNQWVHQNPKIWGSYEAEVKNVIDYLNKRFAWMDKKVGYDPNITSVDIAENDVDWSDAKWYDLSGKLTNRTNAYLSPGVYILRKGDSSRKVIIQQ